ncbi:MAG: hypothetical protein J6R61_06650 [Bacteroidales bacterium]|nr:hypothetical protein [Bacteroidales bacterium]
MKFKRFIFTLLCTISIISFSSCLGDKGNVLKSYDVGTIVNIDGQPIIKTDNIHINLTGSGLELPIQNEINRCLFTFTLDWDNQPEGAYESGIYNADIVIQEKWNASLTDNIANKPFAGSDSINNVSEPYLTVIGEETMISFQSSYEKGDNTSVQFVKESVNEATKTITLDYIYYTGNAPTITTTEKRWQSYVLPKFDTNYTLIFRFKSLTQPSFKTERFKSPDGDQNKNCYLYTLQYKTVIK